MDQAKLKAAIKAGYGAIAKQERAGCCGPKSACCGSATSTSQLSREIGYGAADLETVPQGANLGLGCGNPVALASVKTGETVLDLGAGAGFDAFLAANRVGPGGRVIGVDLTPEMVAQAQANALKGGYNNVEFRLGEIEDLPVADDSVDLIISNCVINLVPDKRQAFQEAWRVLKPGGRMLISDLVLEQELPELLRESIEAYVGCLAGASLKDDYLAAIRAAGFKGIKIMGEDSFPIDFMVNDPTVQEVIKNMSVNKEQLQGIAATVKSIKVYAEKPR